MFRTNPLMPVLGLTLLILVSYGKLTTMQGVVITDDIFTSDLMNHAFPARAVVGAALKRGEAPLWNPYVYGGFPILAGAQSGACDPVHLALFGLLPPYVALNVTMLWILTLAAVGMYFYARELGASVAGGLVAAVSFAYSGFMVSHLKHMSMVAAVAWFPWGLLLLERALRRFEAGDRARMTRFLAGLSVVFGLQILAGSIQPAYYAGLVYVLYVVARVLRMARRGRGRKSRLSWRTIAISAALALLLGTALGAVQLLPTYELLDHSRRAGGVTFEYARDYAYDPDNFKTFFYPYANGDIGNGTYTGQSIFWEDYGYAGLGALLLAIFAVATAWRGWHVGFFAAAGVVSYALVLGPNTPVYEIAFQIVPGMKFFRFPTRLLFVVDASIAVLAAVGLTRLERIARRRARVLGLAAVALVTADLLFFQMRQNPIALLEEWGSPPATARKLGEDDGIFRIYSPGAKDFHMLAFATARGWQGDLGPYIAQREFLQTNTNALYGLESADGYTQLTPEAVVDVWGDQHRDGLVRLTATVRGGTTFVAKPSFEKIMNMFNVKYVVSPWRVVNAAFEPIEMTGDVRVYRNRNVLPRAYLVWRYRMAPDATNAKAILMSDGFDPASEVILHEQPPTVALGEDTQSTATVEHYGFNEVVVRVASGFPALLVLADTYYPGWKAEVDGDETKIYQANVCQRAVVVPAGEHVVRFAFQPPSVRWGLGITVGALVLLGTVVLNLGRRVSP